MIDMATFVQELEQARSIRQAAEAACHDVEELLGEMQRGPTIWQRLTMAEGADDELHLVVEGPIAAAATIPQPMPLAA